MSDEPTEACGRCGITAVIDATGEGRDVLGEDRIEVEEGQLRRLSAHHVLAARAKAWLDSAGERLIYGR